MLTLNHLFSKVNVLSFFNLVLLGCDLQPPQYPLYATLDPLQLAVVSARPWLLELGVFPTAEELMGTAGFFFFQVLASHLFVQALRGTRVEGDRDDPC